VKGRSARVGATRLLILLLCGLVFASIGAALATEEPAEGEASRDRLLAEGRVVYEANCMACHQTDGAGLSGVFPPLADNVNVQDTDYVVQVVTQGLQGELTIEGVAYNGIMPAFAALSEDQISSLVLYVQEGLGAPTPTTPSQPTTAPPSSDGLPLAAVLAAVAGFGVAGVGLAAVVGPVAIARRSDGRFTTFQVWLKALAIFAYFVLATVFLPSLIVESSLLARPPAVYEDLFSGEFWGVVRDVIGTAVWLGALGLGLWALRRAQREDMI